MLDQGSRELLIGVVAVVALAADVETFTLRQVLLGLLLVLFLAGSWKVKGSGYEQVCYAAVAGFCGLLTLGYPVQRFIGAQGQGSWLEVGFAAIVVLILAGVFILRKIMVKDTSEKG